MSTLDWWQQWPLNFPLLCIKDTGPFANDLLRKQVSTHFTNVGSLLYLVQRRYTGSWVYKQFSWNPLIPPTGWLSSRFCKLGRYALSLSRHADPRVWWKQTKNSGQRGSRINRGDCKFHWRDCDDVSRLSIAQNDQRPRLMSLTTLRKGHGRDCDVAATFDVSASIPQPAFYLAWLAGNECFTFQKWSESIAN